MASYNKVEIAIADFFGAVHDVVGTTPGTDCDQLDIYLSNATPSASDDEVKADLAEIATGNGYAGAVAVPSQSGTEATGTLTVSGDEIVITASGGSVGPFQYVALFNDGTAVKTDPLIAWWDNGSAVTLADGESFTIQFSGAATGGTLFTAS